jgi:predicted extracellular nuclease
MLKQFALLSILSPALVNTEVLAQCDSEFTAIAQIQGSSDSSPLLGQLLTTRGTVTAIVYPDSKAAGLVLQATESAVPGASHGLFIADSAAAAIYQPGQVLQLSGTVAELEQLTSLTDISEVKLCDRSEKITALALSLPVTAAADWESLEGTLLRFNQPLIVNDSYHLGRYGEVVLADSRLVVATDIMLPGKAATALTQQQQQLHMLVLDDGQYRQNPEPLLVAGTAVTAANSVRIGDTLSQVEGVLLQNARGYYLLPTQKPVYSATNPRPVPPVAKPAKALRIASFNVLNYFNGANQEPAFPTRRGASNTAELARQQAKIVSALAALDADIIGLLEVENNGYGQQSALASLSAALNKVSAKPYRFIITREQPGNDEIKVALLYRPATVSVEGKAAMLLGSPFDWGSRPPLAQSFRHLVSNELITVSINHFKSKGSCPQDNRSPDADQHDGQGCWNALRSRSAKALSDWLATQPTGVNSNKQLILGDFNAYRMEDPLRLLQQNNWQYLRAKAGSQYSYVYQGRTGSLDHALASPALAKQLSDMQHWAINADEPAVLDYNQEYKSASQHNSLYAPTPYRASDHDPLIATFEF